MLNRKSQKSAWQRGFACGFVVCALSIFGELMAGCTSVKYVPCPTIPTYTKTDQEQLKAAIVAHPDPQVLRWIGDYIGLRDQVRSCQAH